LGRHRDRAAPGCCVLASMLSQPCALPHGRHGSPQLTPQSIGNMQIWRLTRAMRVTCNDRGSPQTGELSAANQRLEGPIPLATYGQQPPGSAGTLTTL